MNNISELVEQLQVIASQSIPFDKKLWNTKMIADYLGYSDRQVRERIITLPSFPKPLDIGTGRWKGEDVIKWAESQGTRKGRPRKSA